MKIECTSKEWGILSAIFIVSDQLNSCTTYNFPDFDCKVSACGKILLEIEGKFEQKKQNEET